MLIHDLVIQGVRRFRDNQRLAFRPGLNVVYGPNESGKSTLVNCLLELLYPDRFREEVQEMVSWGEIPHSRAGLTVAEGETVFRILRDFKTNRISLSQFNRGANKYESVSEQATEIAAILVEKFHLPPFEAFRNLLMAEVSRLPSALPLEAPEAPSPPPVNMAAVPPPAPPGFMPTGFGPGFTSAPGFLGQEFSYPGFGPAGLGVPGMMPGAVMPPGMTYPGIPGIPGIPGMPGTAPPEEDDGLSLEEKKKKLERLRRDLAVLQEVEELQFEMDGIQSKLFELEAKKQNVTKLDAAIAKADEVLSQYPLFRGLPENIDERVSRFKDLLAMQAREIEKIDQTSLDFENEYQDLSRIPPFYKQQIFQGGAALFIGGIVASIFLRVLGLLAAGGIGLMAYSIWNFLGLQQRREELVKKIKGFEDQRKAVIKKFEVESAVIQNLMEHAQCDTAEELKGKIAQYREVTAKRAKLEERKKEMILELNWEEMMAEEAELKRKLSEMEGKLRGQTVAGLDKTEIQREVERLEKAIQRQEPQAAAPGGLGASLGVPSLGVPDLGGGPAPAFSAPGLTAVAGPPTATVSPPADPGSTRMADSVPARLSAKPTAYQTIERLVATAAALLLIDREQLLAKVQNRLDLYLQAFSGKLYSAGRIEPGKGLLLQEAASQRWTDFSEISPPTRDLAYFSLQITLLELLLAKLALPLFLDDALRGQDDTRRAVLAKAFKRLAERTQVILFTSQKNLVSLADHALNLG